MGFADNYMLRPGKLRLHAVAFLALLPLQGCKTPMSSSESNLKEGVSTEEANPQCSGFSKEILTNGIWQDQDPASMTNNLIASTLAHHAYPYAWKGATIDETLKGLTPDQVATFQTHVRTLWQPLGVTSAEFIEFYNAEQGLEANGMVLGTSKDVFVVFRGVSRLAQFMRAFRSNEVEGLVGGKKIRLWETNYLAYAGIIDSIEREVLKARLKTKNPNNAKVWLIGHSSGGAYAALSAMDLSYRHPDLKIAGVYTFGSNRFGFDCPSGASCLSSEYNSKFGKITYRWVNDNDLGPFLPNKQNDDKVWTHVPAPEHGIFRITGPTCERVYGKQTENICNRSLQKYGGSNSTCKPGLEDHWSSIYLTKIKGCFRRSLQMAKLDQQLTCTAEILGRHMLKTNDLL